MASKEIQGIIRLWPHESSTHVCSGRRHFQWLSLHSFKALRWVQAPVHAQSFEQREVKKKLSPSSCSVHCGKQAICHFYLQPADHKQGHYRFQPAQTINSTTIKQNLSITCQPLFMLKYSRHKLDWTFLHMMTSFVSCMKSLPNSRSLRAACVSFRLTLQLRAHWGSDRSCMRKRGQGSLISMASSAVIMSASFFFIWVLARACVLRGKQIQLIKQISIFSRTSSVHFALYLKRKAHILVFPERCRTA